MCVPIDTVASIAKTNPSPIMFSESTMPNIVRMTLYKDSVMSNDKTHDTAKM